MFGFGADQMTFYSAKLLIIYHCHRLYCSSWATLWLLYLSPGLVTCLGKPWPMSNENTLQCFCTFWCGPITTNQSLNRLPVWGSRGCSMFPLAFVAGWVQGRWWGFISRGYVVWPTFLLMNVFIALKGSHFWILFERNCLKPCFWHLPLYIWTKCGWCGCFVDVWCTEYGRVDVMWMCGGKNVDDVGVLRMWGGRNVDEVDVWWTKCGWCGCFVDVRCTKCGWYGCEVDKMWMIWMFCGCAVDKMWMMWMWGEQNVDDVDICGGEVAKCGRCGFFVDVKWTKYEWCGCFVDVWWTKCGCVDVFCMCGGQSMDDVDVYGCEVTMLYLHLSVSGYQIFYPSLFSPIIHLLPCL